MCQYMLITYAPGKGPFDRDRLLKDFLLHVMTVVSLIRRVVALIQRNCTAFDGGLVMPKDRDFAGCNFNELSFFQKNEPVRDRPESLGIRSDIVLTDAEANEWRSRFTPRPAPR